MMAHSAEIRNRPARSWFQTEKEKKDVKNKVRAQHSVRVGVASRFRPPFPATISVCFGF